MQQLIAPFLKEQYPDTQISMGVVQAGETYLRGFLKREKTIVEIDNSESLFEIGSITKVFTTQLLAQLIVADRLTGEELLSNYLPLNKLATTRISLKRLANHTSGLPRLPDNFYTIKNYDERNPYLHYDETALLEYFENHLPPNTKANFHFGYSNLGSGVLGYALSKMENIPFQELVNERIFKPLAMVDSSFDRNQKKNSVIGLNKTGAPSDYWEGGLLSGCIGIISSTKDMVKFMCQVLDTENEVSNLLLQKTHQIEANHAIGLGWGIRTLSDGTKSYNHGGGSDGYSCYLKLHRASQSGVILLTNISALKEDQSQLNDLVSKILDEVRNAGYSSI